MRDIIFRGMTENKVWKHGYYWKRSDVDHLHYIIDEGYNNVMVLPKTVGQYAGRMDKNKTKIFEGDIAENDNELYVAEWSEDDAGFVLNGDGMQASFDNFWEYELEVIGNIHENKELLEGDR